MSLSLQPAVQLPGPRHLESNQGSGQATKCGTMWPRCDLEVNSQDEIGELGNSVAHHTSFVSEICFSPPTVRLRSTRSSSG